MCEIKPNKKESMWSKGSFSILVIQMCSFVINGKYSKNSTHMNVLITEETSTITIQTRLAKED